MKPLTVSARSEQQRRAFLAFLVLLLLGISYAVYGQDPPSGDKPAVADELSGKYDGAAKGTSAETHLTLEITNEKGKLSGRLVTPQGATQISEGTYVDHKLSLKLGSGETAGTLTAQLQDDKLTGDWTSGGQKQPIELKKTSATASATTDNTVSLGGEWDGLADAQGEGFPFVLTLKVDGEKVSGESNSSLGRAVIGSGSFKDGKLVFQLDSQSGAIVMSAVVKDGGLVGEFDFAGQAQGRWVAKKRNP